MALQFHFLNKNRKKKHWNPSLSEGNLHVTSGIEIRTDGYVIINISVINMLMTV